MTVMVEGGRGKAEGGEGLGKMDVVGLEVVVLHVAAVFLAI